MTDLRALQWSETDLCDFKTMTVWLPGFRVTQHKKQGAGATENFSSVCSTLHDVHVYEGGGVPRCLCDLSPRTSASASDWTPRSSAPASGSPELTGSTAPVEQDAHFKAVLKYY